MDRVTLFRTVTVAERSFLCDATSQDNLGDPSNEFHGTGMTTLTIAVERRSTVDHYK